MQTKSQKHIKVSMENFQMNHLVKIIFEVTAHPVPVAQEIWAFQPGYPLELHLSYSWHDIQQHVVVSQHQCNSHIYKNEKVR